MWNINLPACNLSYYYYLSLNIKGGLTLSNTYRASPSLHKMHYLITIQKFIKIHQFVWLDQILISAIFFYCFLLQMIKNWIVIKVSSVMLCENYFGNKMLISVMMPWQFIMVLKLQRVWRLANIVVP